MENILEIVGIASAALLILLVAVRGILALFMDKTETDADNKAHSFIGKIVALLEKLGLKKGE